MIQSQRAQAEAQLGSARAFLLSGLSEIWEMVGETGELIGGPDLISRGIVDPRQDAVLEEARDVLVDALHKVLRPEPSYGFLVGKIREVLSGFIYERIRRRPMILSVVTEV